MANVKLYTFIVDGKEHFGCGTAEAVVGLMAHWGPGNYEVVEYVRPEDKHMYDHDTTTTTGVPWCYDCDGWASCGEYADGAPAHPGDESGFAGYAKSH